MNLTPCDLCGRPHYELDPHQCEMRDIRERVARLVAEVAEKNEYIGVCDDTYRELLAEKDAARLHPGLPVTVQLL